MRVLFKMVLGAAMVHFSMNATAQCVNVIPPFSLGADTTICAGAGLQLTPGSVFDTYTWNTGSTQPTITVSQAGTYIVQVGVASGNVIVNGDFELGNTSFTSDYIPGTGGTYGLLSTEGQYAVSTSPSLTHNNFMPCGDHTSGSGNMLVANGAGTPNTNVWCQDVTVTPNTQYLFSCWITNALNDFNVANLQFYVNGSPIGSIFSTETTGCNWTNYNDTWNSGSLTQATICIVNQNTTGSGNDFAIDDIVFSPLCVDSDTIVVSNYPTPVISIAPITPICQGETVQLTASSTTANLDYTWTPGSIQGQTISVSPNTSTIYSVTAQSQFGCTSNLVSIPVFVTSQPPLTITAVDDTLCLGEQVDLTAVSSANVTFQWSPINNATANLTDTPSSTTMYSVIATSPNGCEREDSIEIVVIDPISIDITGDLEFCDGASTLLNAVGSNNNIDFVWYPTQNSGNQQLVDSALEGWIYLEGTYSDCPAVVDSVFTQSIPVPVVGVPDDLQICPGTSVPITLTSTVPGSGFVWEPGNLTGATNSIVVNETTTYTVYAVNGNCISVPASFTIETSLLCDLEVPNVFTPNGDFSNDVFTLLTQNGIESLNCVIVNRWGNKIVEFNQANFAWDGKDKNGNMVHEGSYFYQITAVLSNGEEINKQGFVQLVR